MLLLNEDDRVGPGVESVGGQHSSVVVVKSMHKADNLARRVVHVEDGRHGVETGGMELVRVGHSQFTERGEVLGLPNMEIVGSLLLAALVQTVGHISWRMSDCQVG